MARSINYYRDLLILLLPVGDAWTREVGSGIGQLFTGLAEELARIENRAETLLAESLPSSVLELIDEWEQDWDLPSDCTGTLDTIAERRSELINTILGIEDQSRDTYISRAARLGYTITVTEFAPGDTVPGHPEIPTEDAAFAIQINAPAESVRYFRAGQALAGEALANWGNEPLECAIRYITQAHKTVIFAYEGAS